MNETKQKVLEDLETAVDGSLSAIKNGGSTRACERIFSYISEEKI